MSNVEIEKFCFYVRYLSDLLYYAENTGSVYCFPIYTAFLSPSTKNLPHRISL